MPQKVTKCAPINLLLFTNSTSVSVSWQGIYVIHLPSTQESERFMHCLLLIKQVAAVCLTNTWLQNWQVLDMKEAEGVEEDMAVGREGWVAEGGATRLSGNWSFCYLKHVWFFLSGKNNYIRLVWAMKCEMWWVSRSGYWWAKWFLLFFYLLDP